MIHTCVNTHRIYIRQWNVSVCIFIAYHDDPMGNKDLIMCWLKLS